jgi:regulator of ribonuclease activity B
MQRGPTLRHVASAPVNQRAADLETISALQRVGSNLSRPHALEHHFVSKNRADLESLRSHAILDNYRVSQILSTGRLFKTYFFDIVIDTIPTIENISPASSSMCELAAKYSCSYDGWGCRVVK